MALAALICIGTATEAFAQLHPTRLNGVDSVDAIIYATSNPKDGLHMAYTYNGRTWLAVGNDHSFVSSDFGAWGRHKNMYDPSTLLDKDGTWYAVWAVGTGKDQFATTRSSDFYLWKPQDYPYMQNGEDVLSPVLAKEGTHFIVSYKTSQGNYYQTSSSDFITWNRPTAISASQYNAVCRTQTANVEGTEVEGDVVRVPTTFINRLQGEVALSQQRSQLQQETTGRDEQAFADVQAIHATLTIDQQSTKAISSDLIGIFFEDINYAADGGLYAELIQNRDFEYSARDHQGWDEQTCWTLKGEGTKWIIATNDPIHANNAHYALLATDEVGASLHNSGYDGIAVQEGEAYNLSIFLKSLDGVKHTVSVQLVSGDDVIASTKLSAPKSGGWKQLTATLKPNATVKDATLAIAPLDKGEIGVDFVSLFPQKTFKGRTNGLRADLAQTLADLHPQFVRFPGGCLTHGNGLENMYRWKRTIGPLWEREQQPNIWNYHQSKGFGFYEMFLFCEDIGAEPLPVLPAGVPCQNSSWGGDGQQGGLPMEQMEDYAQELIDLIEWANGDPKTSALAKLRADAGHPAPFNMKMLGIGNEDLISDVFVERYRFLAERIQAAHPEITIVGTVGPFNSGSDYEYGWELARQDSIDIVDEHYYIDPGWYWNNQQFYDKYDRRTSKVYLGEWASRGNTLENALAEAVHICNLERNADVVVMSSYAPLLAREGHTQWNPDLIYFNSTEVKPTVNYYVQKLAGNNAGNQYITSDLSISVERQEQQEGRRSGGVLPGAGAGANVQNRFASSVVKDETTGDMIIKLVNVTPKSTSLTIDAGDVSTWSEEATVSVLSGQPSDKGNQPTTDTLSVAPQFTYTMPAYSFSVIRLQKKTE